jgi:atypical dual specificity phosphatase
MKRFYWLEEGVLAGCSRPGGESPTPNPALLKADMQWLREQGIDALLSLTEQELRLEDEGVDGMALLHLPVTDMTAPQPGQLIQALTFIDRQRAHGRAVAAHCLQGQGRTGTILAAYLVRQGMEPANAVSHLREICPGAIEAKEQERALEAFAKRRDWIL